MTMKLFEKDCRKKNDIERLSEYPVINEFQLMKYITTLIKPALPSLYRKDPMGSIVSRKNNKTN